MAISWFCVWSGGGAAVISEADYVRLLSLVETCPELIKGHLMTPVVAHDPHFAVSSQSPAVVLQLEFADISGLERNLRAQGHLGSLALPQFLPSLAAMKPAHQAMVTRHYPLHRGPGPRSISYWVEYVIDTADENAWLYAYVESHPALLARFPGIRSIEIYTPAIVISGIDLPIRKCLQRNKTVWDTVEDMNLAMASPVRDELRADIANLPEFTGHARHYPFATLTFGAGCPRDN